MNILITGGAGYIGSHVVRALLEEGYAVTIFDDLSSGHQAAVTGGELITGSLWDREHLDSVFGRGSFSGVIHFAAHCLVEESMKDPGKYYRNNICAGLQLLETMMRYEVSTLIFSSSAAVYGEPQTIPIPEDHPTAPTNVYGETKLAFERILHWFDEAYALKSISLRYFNAAGAHPRGDIGEDHHPETHLIPLVLNKALGEREKLYIYGDDYPTKDGTCIRDYIHVNDLASAHILALEALLQGKGTSIYNLGNGTGFSVQEVVETASQVVGMKIEGEKAPRRPGDPAVLVASSEKIEQELHWQPEYPDLYTIIETAWNWHRGGGYGGDEEKKE